MDAVYLAPRLPLINRVFVWGAFNRGKLCSFLRLEDWEFAVGGNSSLIFLIQAETLVPCCKRERIFNILRGRRNFSIHLKFSSISLGVSNGRTNFCLKYFVQYPVNSFIQHSILESSITSLIFKITTCNFQSMFSRPKSSRIYLKNQISVTHLLWYNPLNFSLVSLQRASV